MTAATSVRLADAAVADTRPQDHLDHLVPRVSPEAMEILGDRDSREPPVYLYLILLIKHFLENCSASPAIEGSKRRRMCAAV